jgi:hypothetical protein
MDISGIDFTALREPFKAEDIQWRIIKSGKSSKEYAIVAAYVDNRAIMERLDTIVGIPHWESRFTETVKGMICQLSICGVTKSDGADYTNIEPTKGGISDAMKRAGSQWGIGQYLYKLDTQYAIITPNGSHNGSYKIKENGKDVIHYFKWNPPKLPDWALPKVVNKDIKVVKPEETYSQALLRLKTEMCEHICEDDVFTELKLIAKTFGKDKLSEVEVFDQLKVLQAVEAKIKEIKGDK